MEEMTLDQKLANACDKVIPDFDEIKELITAGADTNQLNKYGESIFNNVFVEALFDIEDNVDKLSETVEKIKETISLMVDNGWDVNKFGSSIMQQFTYSTYDRFSFELFKFMLEFDVADYEGVLESVGSEESYSRCCEADHELENLFYSIYEMIEAKMEGKAYKGIALYYDAVGMTIDKIVYFNDVKNLVKKKNSTEYNADIGFVCGNKVLVLRDGVNILFENDRLTEYPQIDISSVFGEEVVGRKIKAISFNHNNVIKDKTHYGQPIIIIELDNGKTVKFSHNFGETLDNVVQSRFWIK